MDHDLKSLQVFIEGELRADRVAREQMRSQDIEARERMHKENGAATQALVVELAKVTAQTTATNGRVSKLEVAMAVIRFAVFTIGGAFVVAGLQVIVTRFTR